MDVTTIEKMIPIFGILVAIIIPIAVFLWQYHDAKNERAAVVEIAKNLDDPEQVKKLVNLFDERKKEPVDYRRSGLITLFVGVGLFLFGLFYLGNLLKGVGALVFAIGLGQIIAGYVYPHTSEEINKAVEDYEEK